MSLGFSTLFKTLQSLSGSFDDASQSELLHCLLHLTACKLPSGKALLKYHDALLSYCAHPNNKKQLTLVEKELSRITKELKRKINKSPNLQNTGLPHTIFISRYSHDCLTWLFNQSHCHLDLVKQSDSLLNDLLQYTLPSLERSNTTAGLNNKELLATLKVKKSALLPFYLDQFNTLNKLPYVKDYFFDKLNLEVKISARDQFFSRTYNRIAINSIYFHQDWCKHFNVSELVNRTLPKPAALSDAIRNHIINCVKYAMTLNDRETDPTTYLDSKSLRLYELERGLSIALYGMHANRQLPMESYVGFTLFKNGFPASYGGSWIFGKRANFGINIFESFRKGESGYIMCQLLRVYRKVFSISLFEVEPYQFGLDNPEGIISGAFWFYYRYGFRPIDKKLRALAAKESRKIKASKAYRTGKSLLLRFTESSLVLNLGKTTPRSLPSLTEKITKLVQEEYRGNRGSAVAECVQIFKSKTAINNSLNAEGLQVLEEVALVAKAMQVTSASSLSLLSSMVKIKPNDLYAYQEVLLKFLEKER